MARGDAGWGKKPNPLYFSVTTGQTHHNNTAPAAATVSRSPSKTLKELRDEFFHIERVTPYPGTSLFFPLTFHSHFFRKNLFQKIIFRITRWKFFFLLLFWCKKIHSSKRKMDTKSFLLLYDSVENRRQNLVFLKFQNDFFVPFWNLFPIGQEFLPRPAVFFWWQGDWILILVFFLPFFFPTESRNVTPTPKSFESNNMAYLGHGGQYIVPIGRGKSCLDVKCRVMFLDFRETGGGGVRG